LIKHCKDKIATFKLPREVVIVNELPRTPTGKLLRRVLRQKDAEAQAAPQAARTGTG
jgi:acyl-coenzyme A synthetase/AMP-(fatty) acid ligase